MCKVTALEMPCSLKDVAPWEESTIYQTTWLRGCKDLWKVVAEMRPVKCFCGQVSGLNADHISSE